MFAVRAGVSVDLMASRGKTNPDDFTASCRDGGELQEEHSAGPPPLPRRDVKLASFSIICAGNSEPPRGALLFPPLYPPGQHVGRCSFPPPPRGFL